jgi:predicted phosphodiesterase
LLIAGDTHGVVKDISTIDRKAIEENASLILQVGDFGIYWDHDADKYFQGRTNDVIWITVGGNHEVYPIWQKLQREQGNPELVELWPNCYWAPRPTLLKINNEKFLLMGGANSTDRHLRTEGVNWWPYEEPTKKEIDNFFYTLQNDKPDVVVTHEAPSSIHIGFDRRMTRVATDFENVIAHTDHMPRVWYYGHHHYTSTLEVEDTEFICCGAFGNYVVHR